jgi:hypothetical protein
MNKSPLKTDPLDVSSLVVGLVFLGLAGSWALHESGAIDGDALRWVISLTLIAAGAIGVIAYAIRGTVTNRKNDNGGV